MRKTQQRPSFYTTAQLRRDVISTTMFLSAIIMYERGYNLSVILAIYAVMAALEYQNFRQFLRSEAGYYMLHMSYAEAKDHLATRHPWRWARLNGMGIAVLTTLLFMLFNLYFGG